MRNDPLHSVHHGRSKPLLLLAALPALLPWGAARAQVPLEIPADTNLVHLDTPAVLAERQVAGRLDLRVFSDKEDITYVSAAAHYGLGRGWEVAARGAFGGRKTFALGGSGGGLGIRHGGGDVELLAKYRFPTPAAPPGPSRVLRVAGMVGVAFVDTPAQSDLVPTLGIAAAFPAGENVTLYANPRAVFLDDNTIFGIGVGARARLTNNLAVVGDVTWVVAGDNTRSVTTGERRRRDVFGIAVRYAAPDGATSFDLGYANGTGSTTGFALTPGLGNSGALYAALTFRR
jgi:hypothetical protein